jgi:hypothetical protein
MGPVTATAALDGVAGDGTTLDPTGLVRAVTLFHELGPEGSARVLARYGEQTELPGAAGDDGTGAVLVARLLFLPDDGRSLPAPMLGKPDVELTEDPVGSPYFPLMVCCDVPFLPVGGWFLGGAPTSLARYVESVARAGRLRPTPLQPSCSPVEAAERLVSSSDWSQAVPEQQRAYARSLVYRQAARASSAVIPDIEGAVLVLAAAAPPELDGAWHQVVDGTGARELRWDPDSGRFTAAGSAGSGSGAIH